MIYLIGAWTAKDQPIDFPSEDYTEMNYGGIVYMKTYIVFDYLAAYLGQDVFDNCMKEYFEKWKYGLAAASIAIALYFSQIIVDIYQNNTIAIDLLEESESLYYSGFPNEPKVEDLEKLIRQKLKGLEFSGKEPFLLTVQNLTQVIFNNERVSLYSINYELNRNQFVIEIQCSEFEDLEAVKSTFSLGGYSVDIGSSKRVGNSILSEIFIKKT